MLVACEMNPYYTASPFREEFGLTARERQIIALVGAGYTITDLAQELGVSENAASDCLSSVFDKLGVSNRIELLLFAADRGLTQED
jgi:DNA-binding NarL/FixJ family response regulator